jgi:hypothetical protein
MNLKKLWTTPSAEVLAQSKVQETMRETIQERKNEAL